MTRLLRPALAVILLVAGCGFERRPPPESGSGADTASPTAPADTAVPDTPESATVERARAFFRGFQDARRSGGLSEVRSRLHPRALLLLGTRRLPPDASEAELGELLSLEARAEAPPASVAEVTPVASGVLFLVRYSGEEGEGAASEAMESVLLAPDSAGWSVRLLHRSHGNPD